MPFFPIVILAIFSSPQIGDFKYNVFANDFNPCRRSIGVVWGAVCASVPSVLTVVPSTGGITGEKRGRREEERKEGGTEEKEKEKRIGGKEERRGERNQRRQKRK